MRKDVREQAQKVGEHVRMGLKIDAIKEIEELKSEISTESPVGREAFNEADSTAISLLDLAEILDQHKIWVESGGESGVKADLCGVNLAKSRSEERRVGKECRSRWSPYH